jgi:hypothetical protein
MSNIVNGFLNGSNQWMNILMLVAALLRVYLELVKFDFANLPMTKALFKTEGEAKRFHKSGLYLCLGYIALSAPFTLLS